MPDDQISYAATLPAVAVGVSLQISLPGDKGTVVLQSHYDRDGGPEEMARVLDGLNAAGERLGTRAKITALRAMAKNKSAHITQETYRAVTEQQAFEATKARLEAEITQVGLDDQHRFAENGRRGEYAPSESALKRAAGLRAEIRKAEETKNNALEISAINIEQCKKDIANYENEAATLEAQLVNAANS